MLTLEAKRHKELIIMIMALGEAYLEKGLYEDAEKRFQQLIDFKVANRRIYTSLSKAYIGLKKSDRKAIEIYQKAIRYDSSNAEIYDVLAAQFLKDGRTDPEAVTIFESTLNFNSAHFHAIVEHLASIYFRQAEYEKCKSVTEMLLSKSGFRPKPFSFFINSCWKTGNLNDAILQLKKLIDVSENNTMLLKNLCITYLEKMFNAEVTQQEVRFSHIDRQLVNDYLDKNIHFGKLQDLSLYLDLKRFLSDTDYWSLPQPAEMEDVESDYVYHDKEQESAYAKAKSGKKIAFNLKQEIFDKLSAFESLTGQTLVEHSNLTYEDFKKEGAAIFTDAKREINPLKIPEQTEILLTIALANYEHLSTHYGEENLQQIRKKFNVILADILEAFKIYHIFGASNGFIIFTDDVVSAASIAVKVLNKLNRHNFISEAKDEIHLTIGIHHAREGFADNNVYTIKDLSTGLKIAIVNDRDLTAEDRDIYGKIFQRTDRIFLSGKAYREIKSANRFKVNTVGQFKLKYLKENLILHEIAWRNPIDDLRFGYIKKLGRFDLLAELGSKGAVKIFKAKDSTLQRFVILKVIQSEVFNSLPPDNPQKMQFYQTARSLGQMSHPNIANIYEVNEDQRLTYIAREFVEGVPIDEIFKNGNPFNPERLIKIIYQICKGLQYCHRSGFYHLNLNPHNLFIALNDEIKIMDFLIPATLLYGYDNLKEHNPQIYYMSPEQIHGNRGDARSDIFSLGVILYQTVTQMHPFAGKNMQDTIHAILNSKPQAPMELNPRVPKFCEAFILKCLAKSPDRRFQSVEQMVDLLKKTFEGSLFSNFSYQIAQSRDSY
ncbi:MAG: protein kinase [bacterium]